MERLIRFKLSAAEVNRLAVEALGMYEPDRAHDASILLEGLRSPAPLLYPNWEPREGSPGWLVTEPMGPQSPLALAIRELAWRYRDEIEITSEAAL